MATGSSDAASASREFSEDDLADLCEALHKISTKYRFFGLQIGLKMHEIRRITVKTRRDPDDCLLEVLSARLNQESVLTCADVVRAPRSHNVGEHNLALEFQRKFECILHKGQIENEKEASKKDRAKISKKGDPLGMSENKSKRSKIKKVHRK